MSLSDGLKKAGAYFWRATFLRCPVCGRTPIFLPLAKTRRFSDYFEPLDGCPRCGYAYDREPGYFLLAIWAVNYGVGSALGLVLYLIFELNFNLSLPVLFAVVLGPVFVFNILFVRHSKAYFIAFDHLCDPHQKEGGDEGGNRPNDPPPLKPAPTQSGPVDPEPCETGVGVR